MIYKLGYVVTGDYIDNRPIYCRTIFLARRVFLAEGMKKSCLRWNCYLPDEEIKTIKQYIRNEQIKKAVDKYQEFVPDDELRINEADILQEYAVSLRHLL